MISNSKTWEQIKSDPEGTLYYDHEADGLRAIAMRGPASLYAYIGVKEDHPFAEQGCDDVSVNVHGGLTFAGNPYKRTNNSKHSFWSEGYYWYGWDYAHAHDYSFYVDNFSENMKAIMKAAEEDHQWLPDEVIEQVQKARPHFELLMKEAEQEFKIGKDLVNKLLNGEGI